MEFRSIPTVNGHQIGKFDPAYDFLLAEEPKEFTGEASDQPTWMVGDQCYTTKWEGQQLRVTAGKDSVRSRRDTPDATYNVPSTNQPAFSETDSPWSRYPYVKNNGAVRDLSVAFKPEYDAFRLKLMEEAIEPHPLTPFKKIGRCPEIIREWLEFLFSQGVLFTDSDMVVDWTNAVPLNDPFMYPTRVHDPKDLAKDQPGNWGIFDGYHSTVPDEYPFIACRQVYSPKRDQYTWYVIGHYYYYTDPVFADAQFAFSKCSLVEFEENLNRYVGGTRASCIKVCKDFKIDTNKTEGPGLLLPHRHAYINNYNWLSYDSMLCFTDLKDAEDAGVKFPVPVLDLMDHGEWSAKGHKIRQHGTGLDYRLNIYGRRCITVKDDSTGQFGVWFYHVIQQLRSATAWSYADYDTSGTKDLLACNPVLKEPSKGAWGWKSLNADVIDLAERDLIGRVDMKLVLQSGAVVGASVLVGIALYYKTKDATLSTLVAGGVLLVGGTAVVILNIDQLVSILNRLIYENPLVAVAGTGIAAAGAFGAGTALIKKFI